MNGEKGRKHSKSSCIFVWQKTENDFFLTVSSLRFFPYHSNLLEGAYIIFVTIKILKNSLNFKLKKKETIDRNPTVLQATPTNAKTVQQAGKAANREKAASF